MKAAIEEVRNQLKSMTMLTEAETSEVFEVPRSTLRCWRSQGKGPRYFKAGRRVKYLAADVDAFLVGKPIQTTDSLKIEEAE